MKKQLIIFSFLLMASGISAQKKYGAVKTVTVSQAIDQNNYTIHVGLPYLGQTQTTDPVTRETYPADMRFPWDILYLYDTFSESSFDVSKGYFGDKILINWTIKNNLYAIDYLTLHRREYSDSNVNDFETDGNDFVAIANISSNNTEYEDKYVEGGVLYEYVLEAKFNDEIVVDKALYKSYITGIGYRSPTAIITGNVNFKGGNPVRDVTIRANSDGSTINTGHALHVPNTGQVEILNINKPITTQATLQAWMRPETSFNDDSQASIRLFRIENGLNNIDVDVNLRASSNKLEVNIGGSMYELHNYFPSGELNSRGDDVLIPITEFNTEFIHYSIVLNDGAVPLLYINGRGISESYRDEVHAQILKIDPAFTDPYLEVTIPTATNTLSVGGNTTNWSNVYIGSGNNAYIDEIRIWNAAKSDTKIRTDYRRYIGGNDASLITYLRANEGVGQFAYDLSRTGFNYNKNHGKLWSSTTTEPDKVLWITGSGNIPSADQLGILGVTDTNGNYEITAIPYSGTGESFTITPLLGVHQFEPAQQLVFLGQGSEVVNKIDFIDKSSFIFKGRVLANTRGVFQSYVDLDPNILNDPDQDGDTYVSGPGILDEGYNYYQKGPIKYSKGEYWLNDNGTPYDSEDSTLDDITRKDDDYLERYARIPMEGINAYIDGDIVLDENNFPVVSDDEGRFNISVPIGNHYISLKKQGHEFAYNGRFPAEEGTFKEFFEDAEETVNFVDNTRVALVGRVVGGSVESQKVIGFGQDGIYEFTEEADANGIRGETITISSINNIGVASMTLGYTPIGGNITPYTKFNYTTNPESGEYRVEVMPLNYSISQLTGLKILTNDAISLLDADEIVNMSVVNTPTTPEYEKTDGDIMNGEPYHYVKSFTYRSTPVLRVTDQESDEEIEIEGVAYKTEGMQYPIYTQFEYYSIDLDRFERYTNYDDSNEIESLVPVIDGELIVNNNLALDSSEEIAVDENDASKLNYYFRAGLPTISSPFTKTIDIKYRINGVDYPAENYITEGVILGGQFDGSQTFITAAPDLPDIILHDPPGSNSFASIEEGDTFTISSDFENTTKSSLEQKFKLLLGVDVKAGGGLAGPVFENETTNNIEAGIKLTTSGKLGNSLSKTYSFSQTISTSDDPDYVGSDGDLYIGNSKNYYYGSYDDINAIDIAPDSEFLELTNSDNQTIFINKQKAIYFSEEPSNTFFVYSQKYILESLIPELELIISNIDDGILIENEDGTQSRDFYDQQINLWRKTIFENERRKYRVLNAAGAFKSEVLDKINNYIDTLTDKILNSSEKYGIKYQLSQKIDEALRIKDLVNNNFADNISFDAGVGEFSRSTETTTVLKNSYEFNVNVEASFALELGFEVNGMGLLSTTSGLIGQEFKFSLTNENKKNTKLNYTLKDHDTDNLFSVNVINTFGIDGPIFSTVGGKSSCPYEGAELSHFYNHSNYDPEDDTITELPEGEREELSAATQKIEVPLISVEVADLSNVLEGNNAEFTLILENNSVTETDADFLLKVDNLSNPNNALINIEPNGTLVSVPYGQKVLYAMTLGKSVSDVYDYENIRIVLQSTCDGEAVSDFTEVSAHFIPSCTEVVIDAPLENWVYNMEVAYNQDGSTNTLPIKLLGYNQTFNSFQKIDLEYRLATSSTWTRLHTYYNKEDDYIEAINAGGDANTISWIETPELSFPFDIADRKLQDGNYEIRARSTCTNDTDFISEPILGRVDLHAPQRFGTPLPTDGILSSGEDLRVSFNENIFYNSAVSNIEIKGETNQLPIDHNVSLYFEGAANNAIIEKPAITSDDITIEFWMNNNTTDSNALIIDQADGLKIGLNNGELYFTLDGVTAQGVIANDNLYHHYTLTHDNSTGEISIYQDDAEIAGNNGGANLQFTNNNDLIIGGNTFIGNMHDLRLWRKTISLSNAYASMYDKLVGNEKDLIGYWPMTEGRGELAKDLARFKHAKVNASWDIKPKGDSYEFLSGQYLTLDNVDFVQLSSEMDATISFWLKTGDSQNATLFSNGRGDDTDVVQSNGFANKWAINISTAGILSFESEGTSYPLTSASVADNSWHHVALLLNRQGSLRTYIDAEQVSSNAMSDIGGFSGNNVWLGARGHIDLAAIETVDNTFTGKIDEFRLWNTLRNIEQIDRDRFNEVDFESIGLMLYAKLNEQDPPSSNGPRYYHAYSNQSIIPSNAVLSSGAVSYSDDTPAIKLARNLIKFQVNHIINEDDMILEPAINDWASLEGQILDITVHRMFDDANNRQESPITWTAFVNKNDVSWFANGYNDVVDIVKNGNEEKSFEITIINRGGLNQPYTISGIPNWLSLSSTSGSISPDSKVVIQASIDSNLSAGEYLENLYLETDFGFDEKLQIDLRVLAEAPQWVINPNDFDYSMNIIGRIKIDGVFSDDTYDKIAAFHNGKLRGVTNIVYNEAYQEYFVFLTLYSNTASGEVINFSIWDATQGRIIQSIVNTASSITFIDNNVLGSLSNPTLFENTGNIEQELSLNKGWTWISMNVNDPNFSNIDALTSNQTLETSDRILSHSPSLLETYFKDNTSPTNSSWNGTISSNGGLSTNFMYKMKFANAQKLIVKGTPVNVSTWSFPVKQNWNWLPYPMSKNILVSEALALLDPVDGDLIKSQNLFAIYDPLNGWSGTLNYLEEGHGYMLKSSKDKAFKYPNVFSKTSNTKHFENGVVYNKKQGVIDAQYTKYSDNMNAIVLLPEGYNELFVYDFDGILKGAARNQLVGDKALSFITIYGDAPEELTFYIGNGISQRSTSKSFAFKGNNVLGSVAYPVILEDLFLDDFKIFPNPFNNDLTIQMHSKEETLMGLKLFNIIGQLVYVKSSMLNIGENSVNISPGISKGVYFLHVNLKDSNIIYKVIKN